MGDFQSSLEEIFISIRRRVVRKIVRWLCKKLSEANYALRLGEKNKIFAFFKKCRSRGHGVAADAPQAEKF